MAAKQYIFKGELMQKITLITVGKLKEDYYKEACNEYAKRLSAFCDLSMVEIPQEQLPPNPSAGQVTAALESEADQILSKIPKNADVVTLCVEGKLYSSEQLAESVELNVNIGSGNMVFIIGGSFGLSERVKAASKIRLSFSKMTFPHRLARVMLLEQIYRAFQINAGSKYHK